MDFEAAPVGTRAAIARWAAAQEAVNNMDFELPQEARWPISDEFRDACLALADILARWAGAPVSMLEDDAGLVSGVADGAAP